MICGIFGTVKVNSSDWKAIPQLDYTLAVSENTGEIAQKKEARTPGFVVSISEKENNLTICDLRGSLHKEAHGINYNRLTFDELQNTIDHIKNDYGLKPESVKIHSLEIEINLYLKHSPQSIIKSAIAHKKKPFVPIDKYKPSLGKHAVYDDYIVKMYDKGRADGLKGENILRFGVRVRKMRFLQRYGISTLADLQSFDKVVLLVVLLLNAANDIVFFDFNTDTHSLTEKQALRWQQFSNPNYWGDIDKHKAYKARLTLKRLAERLKATDYNTHLLNWVSYEWWQLLGSQKRATFTPGKNNLTAQERATFTHFIFTVQKSPGGIPGDFKKHTSFLGEKTENEKRFCVSCGRDISRQKKGSRFCSEKLYGKQAKQCRNKVSGKTRTLKRQAQRKNEIEKLIFLIGLSRVPVDFVVIFKTPKRTRKEKGKIEQVKKWEWSKVQRVIQVIVLLDGERIVLNTVRAKTFIRYLQGKDIKIQKPR